MNVKKLSLNLPIIVLFVCLIAACVPWNSVAAETKAGKDTLQDTMKYLVEECGQRYQGTPNEAKAANYIETKYKEFGYDNVKTETVPFSSTSYAGRLAFKGEAPDIIGNPVPNAASFGKVQGTIIDLGTDANYAVPDHAKGDIVGMVKFEGNPTLNKANEIAAKVKENDDVNLTGLILTKEKSTSFSIFFGTPTVPCFLTAEYFYDSIKSNRENFDFIERYARSETQVVTAVKPAKSGKPDAIIHLTSHFDSYGPSRGANDNATGVATNLELAKRFKNIDMGNVEVRFTALGAEEAGMLGSTYVRNNLSEAEKAISINLNMDSIAPAADQPAKKNGGSLNAVSMDIYPDKTSPLEFNLPAYLVTDGAKSVSWAPGIENVRIYKYDASDHVKFAEAGIDAANMIVVNGENNELEACNHTTVDNMEDNYSYERHVMNTQLMHNALQKAADLQLSKRADFVSKDMGSYKRVRLENAEQLFKLYDKVTATVTAENSGETYNVAFTKDKKNLNGLPAYDDYKVSNVVAYGSGNADNKDAARNEQYKTFKTTLAYNITERQDYKVKLDRTRGGTVMGADTYEAGELVKIKAMPSKGYRFVGWYNSDTNKKVSSKWNYSFSITKDVELTAKFKKIDQASISVKAQKGKKATIKWKKAEGAYGYQIYRAASKNGTYTRIASPGSSKTSYVNKNLKKGKTYYYKVRVVCKADAYTYGKYSTVKKIKAKK